MKRILVFIAALILLVMTSCAAPAEKKTEDKKPPKKENTMTETMETTLEEDSKTKIDLTSESVSYKTFGRTYVNEKGLNIDFAGSGLEFDVECEGDIILHYNAALVTYFQIYVDGDEYIRFETEVGNNLSATIVEALPEGVHTIRIIRDTDINKNADVMAFSAIAFDGAAESFCATAEKDLFIEFVGDSITAGKYTETQYEITEEAIHKATNSYAYQLAELMDADFSIVARGGCGFFRVSTCPKTMNQLYPYVNGFAKEPVKYVPERKADVVILALGTNDSADNVTESYNKGTVPFATFEEALTDQIRLIREMHGNDVKIVLMYNMMSSNWANEMKAVAQKEGAYTIKVTKNKDGGKTHPSTAGHKVFAKELMEFLEDNVL